MRRYVRAEAPGAASGSGISVTQVTAHVHVLLWRCASDNKRALTPPQWEHASSARVREGESRRGGPTWGGGGGARSRLLASTRRRALLGEFDAQLLGAVLRERQVERARHDLAHVGGHQLGVGAFGIGGRVQRQVVGAHAHVRRHEQAEQVHRQCGEERGGVVVDERILDRQRLRSAGGVGARGRGSRGAEVADGAPARECRPRTRPRKT